MDICLPGAPVLNAARAEASRRNGARSCGPRTPEGKARSFDTLLRYRGSAMAELWRALRALKALQAEAARDQLGEAAPDLPAPAQQEIPIEPKDRGNPGEITPAPVDEPGAGRSGAARPAPPGDVSCPDRLRAQEAAQRCATMRHLCAIDAPPSGGA